MNWKNILTKGLPVVGILLAGLIVFTVASRPKAVPKVSNPNETVVDFHNLKLSKSELYELMKTNYALNIIKKDVDSTILADYFDDVDQEALQEEIDKAKEEGDQTYFDNLAYLGYIQGANESDEAFSDRVEKYFAYTSGLLAKAAATEIATAEVKADTDAINEAKTTYANNRDICVISLEYTTAKDYNEALAEIESKPETAVHTAFTSLWEAQQDAEDDDTTEENDEETTPEEDFFSEKLVGCTYDKLVYDEVSNSTYRDLAFGLEDREYKNAKISNTYYIVYKLFSATHPDQYSADDKTTFEQIIVDRLIDKKVTTKYIDETVQGLREDAGFKIFDYILAEQYAEEVTDFEVSKSKDKTAVYELNGKTYSADDLYEQLKVSGAVSLSMDKIYYEALTQIKEIALTKEDKKAHKEQVAAMKAEFLNSGYDMTWADYIKLYGANSEEDLQKLIAIDLLSSRYILGYEVDDVEKYKGAYPVAQSEIDALYDEWFEVAASHILFNVDKDADDVNVQKQKAELLAKQVIYGVDAENDSEAIVSREDWIYYDYNGDGNLTKEDDPETNEEEEIEYFKGLLNTEAKDYAKVFADLAKRYSDDTGSATNGGSLDTFGPGKMVPEFEAAVKKIAANLDTDVPFSTIDDDDKENDTLAESDFGVHVIYVTSSTDRPVAPAGYENSTIDEIQAALETETNTELKTYYDFILKFETTLEDEHTSGNQLQKQLNALLDSQDFKFEDETIQAYYEKLVEIQARLADKE